MVRLVLLWFCFGFALVVVGVLEHEFVLNQSLKQQQNGGRREHGLSMVDNKLRCFGGVQSTD